MKNGFKVIDIEQHCTTPKAARFYPKNTVFGVAEDQKTGEFNAFGIGEKQLEVMDRSGIDFAQVSLMPSAEFLPVEIGKEFCSDANDLLAEAVIGIWKMKNSLILILVCFLAAAPLFAQENLKQGSLLVNSIPMPGWLQTREKQDLNRVIPGDEAKIRYAVQLAAENVRQKTGGPFAAAIFDLKSDRLIALGVNVVVPSCQSWAHAEMVAFAHAQNLRKNHSLAGCVLVTSCEPCAMCSGATPWSGVGKMIYGATKEMAEAAGFDEGYKGEKWRTEFEKRKIKVVGPLLGKEANEPFEIYKKMQGKIY